MAEFLSHGPGAVASPLFSVAATALRGELARFELGRWLLENKGLNGRWTEYVMRFPDRGARTNKSSDGSELSDLEKWILMRAPIFLATQERFRIFQAALQRSVDEGARKLVSMPCGLLDDLLSLQYDAVSQVTVIGVDKDPESLRLAQEKVCPAKVTRICVEADAWNVPEATSLAADVLTSNGLNIYVRDDAQCQSLYESFAKLLRPGGLLVTSFITPPETWQPYSLEDLQKQRTVFLEAIGVAWQCTRSEELTRRQLAAVGFEQIECRYDQQRMFPTVLARKR